MDKVGLFGKHSELVLGKERKGILMYLQEVLLIFLCCPWVEPVSNSSKEKSLIKLNWWRTFLGCMEDILKLKWGASHFLTSAAARMWRGHWWKNTLRTNAGFRIQRTALMIETRNQEWPPSKCYPQKILPQEGVRGLGVKWLWRE